MYRCVADSQTERHSKCAVVALGLTIELKLWFPAIGLAARLWQTLLSQEIFKLLLAEQNALRALSN